MADEIDLNAEEEAALERAWEKLDRQRAQQQEEELPSVQPKRRRQGGDQES